VFARSAKRREKLVQETDWTKSFRDQNEAEEAPEVAVEFHFVVPETVGDPFDAHGLGESSHKEFQVLVLGYCRHAASAILKHLADAVINGGEEYSAGDTVNISGVHWAFEGVPGDFPSDPTRLRIVDVPGGCECEFCHTAPAGDVSASQHN
jgi:hypothetical protein